ncbi:MAG: hypothetical protein M0P95_11415 [Sulfuritalea sp.]|jgi:predicted aspartyl protease|nr:hypothetical protein [Sulfuritalea sp.]
MYGGTATADAPYRCTDETGLVLLTNDAHASKICEMLSEKRCAGKPCPITITKNQDGRLYINGTTNGTSVRYPVAKGASAVTICVRDQCKAQ